MTSSLNLSLNLDTLQPVQAKALGLMFSTLAEHRPNYRETHRSEPIDITPRASIVVPEPPPEDGPEPVDIEGQVLDVQPEAPEQPAPLDVQPEVPAQPEAPAPSKRGRPRKKQDPEPPPAPGPEPDDFLTKLAALPEDFRNLLAQLNDTLDAAGKPADERKKIQEQWISLGVGQIEELKRTIEANKGVLARRSEAAASAPAASAPAASAPITPKAPTIDEMRAALQTYSEKNGLDASFDLLSKFGAGRVSDMVNVSNAEQIEFMRLAQA